MSKKVVKKVAKVRFAVVAPGLTEKELKNLRKQVEMSMLDPDYVIITNYEFHVVEFPAEFPCE